MPFVVVANGIWQGIKWILFFGSYMWLTPLLKQTTSNSNQLHKRFLWQSGQQHTVSSSHGTWCAIKVAITSTIGWNGANSPTPTLPFRTITRALRRAKSGTKLWSGLTALPCFSCHFPPGVSFTATNERLNSQVPLIGNQVFWEWSSVVNIKSGFIAVIHCSRHMSGIAFIRFRSAFTL